MGKFEPKKTFILIRVKSIIFLHHLVEDYFNSKTKKIFTELLDERIT